MHLHHTLPGYGSTPHTSFLFKPHVLNICCFFCFDSFLCWQRNC